MPITTLDLQLLLPGHAPREDACTARLVAAVAALRGVVAADFRTDGRRGALSIEHDPAVVDRDELATLAHDAALEVSARFVHRELLLTGLHCSDCATKVAAVTRKLDGVFEADASFATEKLHLGLDTEVSAAAEMLSRVASEVEGLGYRVVRDGSGGAAILPPPGGRAVHVDRADALHEHASHAHGTTGSLYPAHAARPDAAGATRLTLHGLPADLRLSLVAGACLAAGFALQTAGAPPLAWLPAYLAAYVAGGWNATNHAVRAARRARFDIDLLMVVAALGAASLGSWAEGALLLFLFSLGHSLEHLAMDRARGAIRALGGLTPKTARVRRDAVEAELPLAQLRLGDTVIVRPGERLPADGRVTAGASHVDQAPITGESMPVRKGVGDEVYAGTINADGSLEVQTTRAPEDTTLARVIRAVESAQRDAAPSQRLTDRFQRVFSPVVLGVTALMVVVPPLLGAPFEASFMRAMVLLVASSPCALALATPSAVLAGIARGARSGVLIKGGAHLENAGMADVVVLDKTGTLTRGRPELTDVVVLGGATTPTHVAAPANVVAPAGDERRLLTLVAGLESRSAHPLAGAILGGALGRLAADAGHAHDPTTPPFQTPSLPSVTEFAELSGHGVTGTVDGVAVLIGNRKLMASAGVSVSQAAEARAAALEGAGKTTSFVAVGQAAADNAMVAGVLAVRDEPRPEAAATVAELRRLGVKRLVMLTGDHERVARAVGAELGLDEVHAGLLPEDKARIVDEFKGSHHRVIVVGDGINDAPAMAEAHVAVAMGGAASDVALEAADVALMADDLGKLPYAIALSRASRRMIVQNLFVSMGVIALLVPSAVLGLASIGVAVVIHESSTLVVVANALRLLAFRPRHRSAA
jgi:Cd2+/Zn2+-exporting ATPase